MRKVSPIASEKAQGDLRQVYDRLHEMFGRVPNIFGVMAHRPAALQAFLPFMASIMNQGAVEAKYKELAYLKASMVNGCEY